MIKLVVVCILGWVIAVAAGYVAAGADGAALAALWCAMCSMVGWSVGGRGAQ